MKTKNNTHCYCGEIAVHSKRVVHTAFGEMTLGTCNSCGLTRDLNPPVSDVLYTEITNDWFQMTQEQFENRVKTMMPVAEKIGSLFDKPGSVLDVGCNAGYLTKALQRKGWNAEGLELNPAAREFARSQGISVASVPLENQTSIWKGKFDLVVMSHVAEHVTDLKSLFRAAAEVLKPGGKLYVAVPNFGSIPARTIPSSRTHLYLPGQHLWYFDKSTLARCIEAAGFEISGRYSRIISSSESKNPVKWVFKNILMLWMRLLDVGEELIVVGRSLSSPS